MTNFVRKPVYLIEENTELLKSQVGTAMPGQPGWAGQRPNTNYVQEESVPVKEAGVESSYRVPAGRKIGNQFFRRYPDGTLDIEAAKHVVIDALHRAQDCGGADQLNSREKVVLSVLFPQSFSGVDSALLSSIATVQLRLSPEEVELIRAGVAAHLAAEMNYNAGMGGGSVPGRKISRS